MASSQIPAQRQNALREEQQDEDPSEPRRSTGWASAAQERHDGQIGNGLLHNIEVRLGSIM
ncbi:MAG: hypothetical protein AAFY35_12350 [Pseudomonadota bacterium]